MTCCKSAMRCTIYLCLTLSCLYVSYFSVEKYLSRPTATKVSKVNLQSGDVPSFAICPQPSVNVTSVEHLIGINMSAIHQTLICKMGGCAGLDYFGHLVEENRMNSKGVRKLYNALKFSASDVILDVSVQLTNSSMRSISKLKNLRYMQPLYELGDCPVFKVPQHLGTTSKIA